MTTPEELSDLEPPHASSSTDHLVSHLQLFGYQPSADEPDPREPPEEGQIATAVAGMVELLVATLADTRCELDLGDLLWSLANLFHRSAGRVQHLLDGNEAAQQRGQQEQDGSEVRSVELERLLDQGRVLLDRRDSLEAFRDHAADAYSTCTGLAWRPHAGSQVNHRTLTAATIDSRDFLAARRRAETQVMLPPGPRIAFTGGQDCNDHQRIWAALDRVHAKHPGMVLLHGGAPKGAELIAARWAQQRKVPQIAFKPDWTRHAKAAPFKRNDALLDTLPIGVVVFPGSGISDSLADKARKLGSPLFAFRKPGA